MMDIENETREMFMSLPTWNARDALRMLLEVFPDSVELADDFDGTEIEQEARALIRWLYRYGILPRAIREPDDAAPELIDDYLDAIGEVRRTPVEWITAATANPGAPAEWLALLQPHSGAPESDEYPASVARPLPAQRFQEQEILRVISELGYDAKALPKPKHGTNGVKAAVRQVVPLNSTGVFDKAWGRLRSDGEIQDAT